MLSDIQSNASLLGLDNSERREMTDDEIATFNYLYAQDTANGDAEHKNAYAYIDYLTSDLNYRQRAKAEEEWAAYAKEHPVGSSAFSVLGKPPQGPFLPGPGGGLPLPTGKSTRTQATTSSATSTAPSATR